MSFVSLRDQIALDAVECLNLDSESSVRGLFSPGAMTGIRSDIDPQLLLSIPFNCSVKLGGLKFTPGNNPDAIPEGLRLFTNRVSMGFSDAESLVPVQTISFEELVSGETVPLKYALFQNVVSLQIFVDNNKGCTDQSEIGGIEIFGTVGEQMNMKEFKKIKDDE